VIRLKDYTIDTEYEEPVFAGERWPVFAARVRITSVGYTGGSNILNVPMFDIACDARVAIANRFYANGSTAFPGQFSRRIFIIVTPYVSFPSMAGDEANLGPTNFTISNPLIEWQLLRVA